MKSELTVGVSAPKSPLRTEPLSTEIIESNDDDETVFESEEEEKKFILFECIPLLLGILFMLALVAIVIFALIPSRVLDAHTRLLIYHLLLLK